jgi:flavin-dependent dehydrogenase
MPERFDAAVIGSGPAGAAVALSLVRQGFRVALFEATAFEGERYGETLPPEINPLLRELGVFNEFRAAAPLESPGLISVWGGACEQQDYLCNPHGPGWQVNRNRFDAMLCRRAVEAGAVCFQSCRPQVSQLEEVWRVGEIEARLLVDATGRNGLRIEGADAERETEDRLLAIVLRLTRAGGMAHDLRTYVESAPDGWWYSAPLPQGELIAMFFTDCDWYTRQGILLEEQLIAPSLTQSRLNQCEVVSTHTVYAPSSCRKVIAGPSWLAVGDSASCFDPLSGSGIVKALRQATNAAIAIQACLEGNPALMQDYAGLVRREFDAYILRRRMHYASEKRWKGREFWAKRGSTP